MLFQKFKIPGYKKFEFSQRKRFVFVLIISITLACSSSRDGLKNNNQERFCELNIESQRLNELLQTKSDANKESKYLFKKLEKQIESNHKINAETINRLFKNLKVHYAVDSIFHQVIKSHTDESTKKICWENLMKSADLYGTTFQRNKKIRCIINRGNIANRMPKNWLCRTQEFLWNDENFAKAKAQELEIKSFQEQKLDYLYQECSDNLTEIFYKTAGICSETTSRLFYLFRSDDKSDAIAESLFGNLQKWDIICKKTSKNLTDRFIPGFFGHVGIYMGNGIVAESVQEGVMYSQLAIFTNANSSYLVVRPNALLLKDADLMEENLKAQIGKSFDFNFDIESPDQLICTELVYLVFDQINWHSERIFWREIIYPDFIVKTALENPDIEFPFFIDEDHMMPNPDSEFISDLLERS